MKSFKEQLKIIRDNDCSVCSIIIANSCDAIFDFEYTDEEFERLCGVAINAYLHAEGIGEDEIAQAINVWMHSCGNIDELESQSVWSILEAAADGWDCFDGPWCEGWTSPEDCDDCEFLDCNCNPKSRLFN